MRGLLSRSRMVLPLRQDSGSGDCEVAPTYAQVINSRSGKGEERLLGFSAPGQLLVLGGP